MIIYCLLLKGKIVKASHNAPIISIENYPHMIIMNSIQTPQNYFYDFLRVLAVVIPQNHNLCMATFTKVFREVKSTIGSVTDELLNRI